MCTEFIDTNKVEQAIIVTLKARPFMNFEKCIQFNFALKPFTLFILKISEGKNIGGWKKLKTILRVRFPRRNNWKIDSKCNNGYKQIQINKPWVTPMWTRSSTLTRPRVEWRIRFRNPETADTWAVLGNRLEHDRTVSSIRLRSGKRRRSQIPTLGLYTTCHIHRRRHCNTGCEQL